MPSDLCSTKVGLEIVKSHPDISENDYRVLVTAELKNLVNTLGYNAPDISRKKFEAIDGRWVYYNNLRNNLLTKTIGHTGPDYLHKRNFDTNPWLINTPRGGRPTFAIGNPPPECISSFLRAKNQLRPYFAQLSFYKDLGSGLEKRKNSIEEVEAAVSETRRISTHGRDIYTTGHDSP